MLDGLPKSLRIGCLDIEVQIVDELSENGEDYWGDYTYGGAIKLVRNQPDPIFATMIVLHEITHACYKIGLFPNVQDEERIAETVSAHFTQIFRDNPALLTWMQGALAGPTSSDIIWSRTSSQEAGS